MFWPHSPSYSSHFFFNSPSGNYFSSVQTTMVTLCDNFWPLLNTDSHLYMGVQLLALCLHVFTKCKRSPCTCSCTNINSHYKSHYQSMTSVLTASFYHCAEINVLHNYEDRAIITLFENELTTAHKVAKL